MSDPIDQMIAAARRGTCVIETSPCKLEEELTSQDNDHYLLWKSIFWRGQRIFQMKFALVHKRFLILSLVTSSEITFAKLVCEEQPEYLPRWETIPKAGEQLVWGISDSYVAPKTLKVISATEESRSSFFEFSYPVWSATRTKISFEYYEHLFGPFTEIKIKYELFDEKTKTSIFDSCEEYVDRFNYFITSSCPRFHDR